MGVLFFITTVCFALLFFNEREKNKNLRESLRLWMEESRKGEKNANNKADEMPEKSETKAGSAYDTSYKAYRTEKPRSYAAEQPLSYVKKQDNTEPLPPKNSAEKNPPARELPKISSINVMLILGALLIILAGLIFATTTWKILGNGVKAAMILSFSAVFFAASSLSERKLKLPKTGMLFYILGSAFLPITIIASGYFRVFGVYLSLFGRGKALVIAAAFASLAAVSVKGSFDYRKKPFVWCSLLSISGTVMSLICQISDKAEIVSLLAAVYSLIVILLSSFAEKKLAENKVLSDIIKQFSLLNTAVLSVTAIYASFVGGETAAAACGLFAAAYIFGAFSDKTGFGGALPFLMFISFALFAGVSPDDFSEGTYVVAVIATVVTVLSFLKVLPEKLMQAFIILSNICITVSAAAIGLSVLADDVTLIKVIIFALLSAEILLLGIFRRKETSGKIMMGVFSFSLCATLCMTVSLITVYFYDYDEIASVSIFILSILYIITDKLLEKKNIELNLRTWVSDVIFALFLAPTVISMSGNIYTGISAIISAAAASALFAFFPKKDWEKAVFMLCMAVSVGVFAGDGLISEFSDTAVFAVIASVLLAAVLAVMFLKKDKLMEYGAYIGFSGVVGVYIFISGFKLFSSPDPTWHLWLILAAAYIARGAFRSIKGCLAAGIVLSSIGFAMFPMDVFGLYEKAGIISAGIFAFLLFTVLLFVPQGELVKFCRNVSFFCLDAASFLLMCSAASEVDPAEFIIALFILTAAVTAGYLANKTVWIFPSLCAFYPVVWKIADDRQYIVIAAVIVVTIALSYLLHTDNVICKKNNALYIDSFAVSRFFGVICYYLASDGKMSDWWGIWLIGVCVLSLIRRKGECKKLIAVISLLTPVFAWILRPFAKAPECYTLEINIVPILLYLAALRLFKWQKRYLDHITFAAYVIIYIILFFNALFGGIIGNALIIMISALVMLVFSFVIKMKRWFILAVAVITTSAIFMSITLWGNPAWWVYLLVAGIIMIVVGAANEMKKRSADNEIGKRITRFMSEWTW